MTSYCTFFSKIYFKKWTGSFKAAKVGAEITALLSQPPPSAGITGTHHRWSGFTSMWV